MSEEEYNEPAKFNMAIDTLKRLSRILEDIKNVTYSSISVETKQILKIDLVKQFFIQASPLLKDEYVKTKKDEILEIKPATVDKIESPSMKASRFKGTFVKYDNNLNNKLDLLLIEIQQELQKDKYFMPPVEEEEGF